MSCTALKLNELFGKMIMSECLGGNLEGASPFKYFIYSLHSAWVTTACKELYISDIIHNTSDSQERIMAIEPMA